MVGIRVDAGVVGVHGLDPQDVVARVEAGVDGCRPLPLRRHARGVRRERSRPRHRIDPAGQTSRGNREGEAGQEDVARETIRGNGHPAVVGGVEGGCRCGRRRIDRYRGVRHSKVVVRAVCREGDRRVGEEYGRRTGAHAADVYDAVEPDGVVLVDRGAVEVRGDRGARAHGRSTEHRLRTSRHDNTDHREDG